MKHHALFTILGWSAVWVCGTLAVITDPTMPTLMCAYILTAFAGLVIGTGSFLKISQEAN